MDLKSAHSQESDFQESGEVDRRSAHFQKRSGSLERSSCYMVRLLAMPRVFVAFDTKQGPHSSKNLSSRKYIPNDIPRRVGPREEIQ